MTSPLLTPRAVPFCLALALAAGATAQQQPSSQLRTIDVGAAQVRFDAASAAWRASPTSAWQALTPPDTRLMFRYGVVDPAAGALAIAADLRADDRNQLFVVQFHTQAIDAYRRELQSMGVRIFNWLPFQSYLVAMPRTQLAAVQALSFVRWAGPFHIAWKIEPELADRIASGQAIETQRYNVVVLERLRDRRELVAEIEAAGGKIDNLFPENAVLEATLTQAQLVAVARSNHVLWIDRWSAPEYDIDNARIQGGANYIEVKGGFTGKGVRGEIFEGIYLGHPEHAATAPHRTGPIVHRAGGSSHGHQTYSEIFSKGVTAKARGLLPDGQGIHCYNGSANVTTVIKELTDPNGSYKGMFQTASWGGGRTTAYTSASVTLDTALFVYDIPRTTSQSNAGTTQSRPEAWCKNVISGGGARHYDNSNPGDDKWLNTGSIGPAIDGRIKPDLCAYYDAIYCAYSTSSTNHTYTTGFGGTSGATPIIAGHVGLSLELYTDGLFGHTFKNKGWQYRFENRPHMTTTKALVINTARQYAFSGQTHDLTRVHQGWGFPNVADMYDLRDRMLVLDEVDVLKQKEVASYAVFVPPGTPQFRVTMTFADPAGTANTTVHRVNDLDLRVSHLGKTQTSWWGNYGLGGSADPTKAGNYSLTGGSADRRDTVENVLLQTPAAGYYLIEVTAESVNTDSHTETTATDADFALVASGIGAGRDRSGMQLDLGSTKTGDLTVTLKNLPTGYSEGFTMFSLTTPRPLGFGRILGMEFDSISWSSLGVASAAGNPFHFPNHKAQSYPNAPYAFPAGLAVALKGITIDAVAIVVDGKGDTLACSNVARVQVQ